jgi:hypothetical protein
VSNVAVASSSSGNSGDFKSKILDSLTPIEPHFEGRVIKSAKLIFRAS